MTILQIRSAYVVTIAIMFYTLTVIVNWVVNIYTRRKYWKHFSYVRINNNNKT